MSQQTVDSVELAVQGGYLTAADENNVYRLTERGDNLIEAVIHSDSTGADFYHDQLSEGHPERIVRLAVLLWFVLRMQQHGLIGGVA